MKYTKIYCIETYYSSYCSFFKDKIYNAKINNFYSDMSKYRHVKRIYMIDDKGNSFEFDDDSPFSINTFPKHFINISELRKEKLENLNSL